MSDGITDSFRRINYDGNFSKTVPIEFNLENPLQHVLPKIQVKIFSGLYAGVEQYINDWLTTNCNNEILYIKQSTSGSNYGYITTSIFYKQC